MQTNGYSQTFCKNRVVTLPDNVTSVGIIEQNEVKLSPTHCQTLPFYLMLMVHWVYRLTETDLYLGHTQSCSGLTPESWSRGQSRHLPHYLLQCFFWSSFILFVVCGSLFVGYVYVIHSCFLKFNLI